MSRGQVEEAEWFRLLGLAGRKAWGRVESTFAHSAVKGKWQATRNKDVKGTSETKQSKAFEDSLELLTGWMGLKATSFTAAFAL